ncbi:MAG: peptidoglycan-binding protein [Clostridia bacterium]|nr:peptidoglycan-binding protein [Clostridia bacterium]
MKKKLGLSLLIVLLLVSAFSLAQASDTEMRSLTAEEEAFSVYLDISSAYKEGVRYLEELDYVWSQVNSVDSVSALDEHWFLGYLINTPQDKIYNKYFYLGNLARQFGMDAASDLYAVFRDQMQSRSKKTDAIWVILDMLAESGYIQNAKDILASIEYAKSGIRSVMAQDKEYPFLEELKSYYKDAVILQEYIDPFNDSYINFCPKLDEFKKTKTSWEIEFEFIFDPSSDEYDYVYTVRDERDYQLALAKESAGDYRGAAEIYMGIRQHKDSDARYNICMATIESTNKAEKENIYLQAIELENNAKYDQALALYKQIDSYKDSNERAKICEANLMKASYHTIVKNLFPDGTSFETHKDDIAASLTKNNIEASIYPQIIRINNYKLSASLTPRLLFWFNNTNIPNQATKITFEFYGNISSSAAASAYSKALSHFENICGTPAKTNKDQARPTYNKLNGNTAGLISGPAYKDSDFAGKIDSFAEWLVDSGEYWLNIIVYNKYYPAHRFYEVSVLCELVPYAGKEIPVLVTESQLPTESIAEVRMTAENTNSGLAALSDSIDTVETTAPQYKTLKPGSKGQAVLDARMKLYELGYFNKKPTQTEYTNNMKDYVKKFEKDYGLKQDGILSPEDQEVLFGL